MGTDFLSYNRIVLAGQVVRVGDILKNTLPKALTVRLMTKEVYLYGEKKNQKPKNYYHFIRVFGSMAEYCAKHVSAGDLILVEGMLRNYPTHKDLTIWRTSIWPDKIIMLTKKEWLKEERRKKIDEALVQRKKNQ